MWRIIVTDKDNWNLQRNYFFVNKIDARIFQKYIKHKGAFYSFAEVEEVIGIDAVKKEAVHFSTKCIFHMHDGRADWYIEDIFDGI